MNITASSVLPQEQDIISDASAKIFVLEYDLTGHDMDQTEKISNTSSGLLMDHVTGC